MSLFVVFEGGEGSGKSTQAGMLKRQLLSTGLPVILTREPGGTPAGNRLRHWVKWDGGITPQSELLFILAARSQLVTEIIRPALDKGTVVICDRYIYSTIAYQGYGRGLDLAFLRALNGFVTGGLQPDLVVLLDIDPDEGLGRLRGSKDRFERETGSFHKKVREGYLKMAEAEPRRWMVLNASLPKKEIQRSIWQRVKPMLGQGAAPVSAATSSR